MRALPALCFMLALAFAGSLHPGLAAAQSVGPNNPSSGTNNTGIGANAW